MRLKYRIIGSGDSDVIFWYGNLKWRRRFAFPKEPHEVHFPRYNPL